MRKSNNWSLSWMVDLKLYALAFYQTHQIHVHLSKRSLDCRPLRIHVCLKIYLMIQKRNRLIWSNNAVKDDEANIVFLYSYCLNGSSWWEDEHSAILKSSYHEIFKWQSESWCCLLILLKILLSCWKMTVHSEKAFKIEKDLSRGSNFILGQSKHDVSVDSQH